MNLHALNARNGSRTDKFFEDFSRSHFRFLCVLFDANHKIKHGKIHGHQGETISKWIRIRFTVAFHIYDRPSHICRRLCRVTSCDLSDVSSFNLPTNLRDFLSFYTIFQFRFGRLKVATPCMIWSDRKQWAIQFLIRFQLKTLTLSAKSKNLDRNSNVFVDFLSTINGLGLKMKLFPSILNTRCGI